MFPGKRRYELVKLPEKWRYGLKMFPEKRKHRPKTFWERRHGPENISEISSFVLEIFHEIRHGLETSRKQKTWVRNISTKREDLG